MIQSQTKPVIALDWSNWTIHPRNTQDFLLLKVVITWQAEVYGVVTRDKTKYQTATVEYVWQRGLLGY